MNLSNLDIDKIKGRYKDIFNDDFLKQNDIQYEFNEKIKKDVFYIGEKPPIFDFDYQMIDEKIIKYPLLFCCKSQFKNELGNFVFKEFVGDQDSIFISTSGIDIENRDSFDPFIKHDLAMESINFVVSYLKYLKIDYEVKYYTQAMMINSSKIKKLIAFYDSRRTTYPTTMFIQNTQNIFNDDCFTKSVEYLVRAKYNLELDSEYFKHENIHELREIINCINY